MDYPWHVDLPQLTTEAGATPEGQKAVYIVAFIDDCGGFIVHYESLTNNCAGTVPQVLIHTLSHHPTPCGLGSLEGPPSFNAQTHPASVIKWWRGD
jgi:hypothetical protein